MKAKQQTDAAPNRRFGVTTGTVFLSMAGYQYVRHQAIHPALLAIGSGLCLLALLLPCLLSPLRIGWEELGHWLRRINTFVLLAVVYFLVCVPLGWLLRRLGKDPLTKKRLSAATTYWEPKEPPTSMKFQF
jgi:hypothetical protein